jgi:hypothetical protein
MGTPPSSAIQFCCRSQRHDTVRYWAVHALQALALSVAGISIPFPYAAESRRFWLDVFFNDQNDKDISRVLSKAELGYIESQYHYALMKNQPLSRCWCLFEFMVRILAGMRAKGLARAEDITPFILDRDPLFTRLVTVDGLTDMERDVQGEYFDKFGNMSAFDNSDLSKIRARILEVCGSAGVFNWILNYYRAAAVRSCCQVKISEGKGALQFPRGTWVGRGGTSHVMRHAHPKYVPIRSGKR